MAKYISFHIHTCANVEQCSILIQTYHMCNITFITFMSFDVHYPHGRAIAQQRLNFYRIMIMQVKQEFKKVASAHTLRVHHLMRDIEDVTLVTFLLTIFIEYNPRSILPTSCSPVSMTLNSSDMDDSPPHLPVSELHLNFLSPQTPANIIFHYFAPLRSNQKFVMSIKTKLSPYPNIA